MSDTPLTEEEIARQIDIARALPARNVSAYVPAETLAMARALVALADAQDLVRRTLSAVAADGDLLPDQLESLEYHAASSGTTTPPMVRKAVLRACAELKRRREADDDEWTCFDCGSSGRGYHACEAGGEGG